MLASPRVLEPSFSPAEQGAEVIFPSLVVWPLALLEHRSVWVYEAASQSQRTRSRYSWVPAHLFRLAATRSTEACFSASLGAPVSLLPRPLRLPPKDSHHGNWEPCHSCCLSDKLRIADPHSGFCLVQMS